MAANRLPSFQGFDRPQDNFYRLPYSDALDWFQFWRTVRTEQVRRTVLAPLKVAEYVIKHTWGQLEFRNPVALSISNFEHGGRYRYITDAGTGLQRRPIIEAIRFCEQLGLLEVRQDASKSAHTDRRYRVRLRDDTAQDVTTTDTSVHEAPATLAGFGGFPHPDQNYFIVPKQWTNLTAEISSDVLILAVEYFFCHCWNWSRERRAEVIWMAVDDIVDGRRYRDKRRPDGTVDRYDTGIGFTHESVRAACHLGVASGLLVRRRIHEASGQLGDEQFSLRTVAMPQGGGYRHYSFNVEFGDLSDLYSDDASGQTGSADHSRDPGRLSAPPISLSAPGGRLNTPAVRLGAPDELLDAPVNRQDAPAERLATPLYVPASVPALGPTDASPLYQPTTTPAFSAASDFSQQSQQNKGAVVVFDSTDALEDCLKVISTGDRASQMDAVVRLCQATIDRAAATGFASQWLMRNGVFESTRRNTVAAHPDPAILVRAIAQFERTERATASDSAQSDDARAWGRKVGGTFKIAARVVALDGDLRASAEDFLKRRAEDATRIRRTPKLQPDQVVMVDMLRWQGFSANDARALAVAYHDAYEQYALPRLASWIDYALSQTSLHSPAAFLRKRLDQLDTPPSVGIDGPAGDFWTWRQSLLDSRPDPLEHPAVDYAMHQQRLEQIERAKAALALAQQGAAAPDAQVLDIDETAPEDAPGAGTGEVRAKAVDPAERSLLQLFGPTCQRDMDLVEMRQWRQWIAVAFARDEKWRSAFERLKVVAVDRELKTAQFQLLGMSPLEAGRFAVLELPKINEVSAVTLALDPAQASEDLIDLLALWREAVREYRTQFGALADVPVAAGSLVPVHFVWPVTIEGDLLVMPRLMPDAANEAAEHWLSERLSDLSERQVRVVVEQAS